MHIIGQGVLHISLWVIWHFLKIHLNNWNSEFEGIWRKTQDQLCYGVRTSRITRIFKTTQWICRPCVVYCRSWRLVLFHHALELPFPPPFCPNPSLNFLEKLWFIWMPPGYARPLVDRIDVENRFCLRLYRPSTISTWVLLLFNCILVPALPVLLFPLSVSVYFFYLNQSLR